MLPVLSNCQGLGGSVVLPWVECWMFAIHGCLILLRYYECILCDCALPKEDCIHGWQVDRSCYRIDIYKELCYVRVDFGVV